VDRKGNGGGHGHSHDHSEEGKSIALQAAVAHVIGDIVQSLGVCLAAGLIWWQPFDLGVAPNGVSRWNYADPLCTVLFGFIVLMTTKSTLARTIETLMIKAPDNMQQELLKGLSAIEGVVQIHDLHIWSIGSSEVLGTAHMVVSRSEQADNALQQAVKVSKALGVGHTTFQVEIEGQFNCDVSCGGSLATKDTSPRRKPAQSHSAHGGDCCDGHAHDDGHSHDAGHSAGHAGHSHGGGGHAH